MCFIFCVWAVAPPTPQQKNNTPPPKTAKINTPPPEQQKNTRNAQTTKTNRQHKNKHFSHLRKSDFLHFSEERSGQSKCLVHLCSTKAPLFHRQTQAFLGCYQSNLQTTWAWKAMNNFSLHMFVHARLSPACLKVMLPLSQLLAKGHCRHVLRTKAHPPWEDWASLYFSPARVALYVSLGSGLALPGLCVCTHTYIHMLMSYTRTVVIAHSGDLGKFSWGECTCW